MRTAPEVGSTSPSSTFRSVVFPHPLGPVMATTSPGSTRNDNPSSAGGTTRSTTSIRPTGISLRVPRAGSGSSSASRICVAAAAPSAPA